MLVPGASAIVVDTHGDGWSAVTLFVLVAVVVSRNIPVAAHFIVDVVAKLLGSCTDASANAEFTVRQESGPFVVLKGVSKAVSIEEATNRIALAVGTSVVQFTTRITLGDVDFGEVSNTCDLNVFAGLYKVNTTKGAIRHGTCAATGLGAVGDCVTLNVTNGGQVGGTEETEVRCGVDPSSLAFTACVGASTTVVATTLFILRRGGEIIDVISDIPGLINVVLTAAPDLWARAIIEITACEIKALALVQPSNAVLPEVIIPVLVIITGRTAAPNLELGAIGHVAFRNIKTLVSEDTDGTTAENPFLGRRVVAALNGDNSTVRVGGGS